MNTETAKEMEAIGQMLFESTVVGGDVTDNYSAEVIWSAMHFLKINPEESISSACKFGLNEWIKNNE